MSETADRVKKIVVEHLGVEEDKVTPDASFIDDLGADSLDIVELVDGLRGRIRRRDPGRRRREDRHRQATPTTISKSTRADAVPTLPPREAPPSGGRTGFPQAQPRTAVGLSMTIGE